MTASWWRRRGGLRRAVQHCLNAVRGCCAGVRKPERSVFRCGVFGRGNHAAGGPDDAGGRINGPGENGREAGEEDDGINETKKMAKQAITLKIAGKSYPFNIESGKEEMYRLAEREVNSYLALIKQQNIKNWNDQDYLSMTALKFAIANVGMRQSREVDSEDLRQLEKIGTEIDAYLNDPKQ